MSIRKAILVSFLFAATMLTYAQGTQTYAVTFKDFNGMILKAEKVAYGQPAKAPAEPIHPGYSFLGWDTPFNNVTGNLEVTAKFQKNKYRIEYFVDDEPYAVDSFAYSAPVTAQPEPKRRTGYKFSGWSKVPAFMPAYDYIVVGSFKQIGFTVTFLDWDGTVLKTEMVNPGSSSAGADTPSREGYVFVGWNHSYSHVTSDVTTTAQYREKGTYTIVFYDWDGTVLSVQNVNYHGDATPPDPPTRPGYVFQGWGSSYTDITASYSIYPVYKANPICTVTFLDWNGYVLYNTRVHQGEAVWDAPTEIARSGYTFLGWDDPLDNVTEDMTVNALYQINTYDVVFKDWTGTTIITQTVPWDGTAAAPAAPKYNGYSFAGWDVSFENVRRNILVTATYSINSYNLTYMVGSTEIASKSLKYYAPIDPIEAPVYQGYKFKGWSGLPDFMPDHDVTVYGTYDEITSVDNVSLDETANAVKIIRNNQLYIVRGNNIYDIHGRIIK